MPPELRSLEQELLRQDNGRRRDAETIGTVRVVLPLTISACPLLRSRPNEVVSWLHRFKENIAREVLSLLPSALSLLYLFPIARRGEALVVAASRTLNPARCSVPLFSIQVFFYTHRGA